jgi:homoserine O-succinyltransferase
MPIVANSALPSFKRFQREGGDVLTREQARSQDMRELHIGLMNMMPDAALEPTERQFLRLVGSCKNAVQFFIYPFSPMAISRGDWAREHIAQHYFEFEELQKTGLDALIISGANPNFTTLSEESFWSPLCRVLDWASIHVTSTLCACLATHAALFYFYGVERQPLPTKRWGIFSHRVNQIHPLVQNIITCFDVPHSRWNEITIAQMTNAGLRVLIESEEAGVHLATSADGFRFVFFQGHPEYDDNSLLKEYKREVNRYLAGEIDDYPPYPDHYFSKMDQKLLATYSKTVKAYRERGDIPHVKEFPENELQIDNTWRDTGKMVFNNWLGTIDKITGDDRRSPFLDGIDSEQPLAHVV